MSSMINLDSDSDSDLDLPAYSDLISQREPRSNTKTDTVPKAADNAISSCSQRSSSSVAGESPNLSGRVYKMKNIPQWRSQSNPERNDAKRQKLMHDYCTPNRSSQDCQRTNSPAPSFSTKKKPTRDHKSSALPKNVSGSRETSVHLPINTARQGKTSKSKSDQEPVQVKHISSHEEASMNLPRNSAKQCETSNAKSDTKLVSAKHASGHKESSLHLQMNSAKLGEINNAKSDKGPDSVKWASMHLGKSKENVNTGNQNQTSKSKGDPEPVHKKHASSLKKTIVNLPTNSANQNQTSNAKSDSEPVHQKHSSIHKESSVTLPINSAKQGETFNAKKTGTSLAKKTSTSVSKTGTSSAKKCSEGGHLSSVSTMVDNTDQSSEIFKRKQIDDSTRHKKAAVESKIKPGETNKCILNSPEQPVLLQSSSTSSCDRKSSRVDGIKHLRRKKGQLHFRGELIFKPKVVINKTKRQYTRKVQQSYKKLSDRNNAYKEESVMPLTSNDEGSELNLGITGADNSDECVTSGSITVVDSVHRKRRKWASDSDHSPDTEINQKQSFLSLNKDKDIFKPAKKKKVPTATLR